MQKARRHPTKGLRPLVGVWFQVLFHSAVRGAFHLSLTVLVLYRSLRSIQPYRMVPADSHRIPRVPRYSGYYYLLSYYVYGIITLYDRTFQFFPLLINSNIVVLQPRHCLNNTGLGCSPFARHYLGNHYYFLFLRLLRCFSSAGQPLLRGEQSSTIRVAPFRNYRIINYLHLPDTYRSLSRLSSPLRAKASTIRPSLLSLLPTLIFNEP